MPSAILFGCHGKQTRFFALFGICQSFQIMNSGEERRAEHWYQENYSFLTLLGVLENHTKNEKREPHPKRRTSGERRRPKNKKKEKRTHTQKKVTTQLDPFLCCNASGSDDGSHPISFPQSAKEPFEGGQL